MRPSERLASERRPGEEGRGLSAAAVPHWQFGEAVGPLRDLLRRGGVLAIPTESSYGLAADPASRDGIEAIYRLKGRERGKALPVVAASVEQLAALPLALADEGLRRASSLWPAALTVLVPLRSSLPAAANEPALAVRVPAHPPLRRLLAALGTPLTATSANPSGELPLLDPGAVSAWLGGAEALVVDGGVLGGGPPSTLAVWEQGAWRVLRQGAYVLPPAAAAPA